MGANITCYDVHGELLSHVYQWNSNTEIHIDGIPTDRGDIVFHFCNRRSEAALAVEPSMDENDRYVASIPNELLEQPDNIILYIYATINDNISETISQIRIPMIPRIKPDGYAPVPYGGSTDSTPQTTRRNSIDMVTGEMVIFPTTQEMLSRIAQNSQERDLSFTKSDTEIEDTEKASEDDCLSVDINEVITDGHSKN